METVKKHVKILAVDDDEFMRIFIKDVFLVHNCGGFSYDFKSVSTIKWAEDYLASDTPDVILLDLSLPYEEGKSSTIENGFAFMKKVKSDPKTKNTNVFVFSGYSDDEIKEKAKSLGASQFFVKGEYLPKDLIEAITAHV